MARQIGEYIIKLRILDSNEIELSSNDFRINVLNEIPEFTYDNIFLENFLSLDSWIIDSYTMQDYQDDNPLTG